MTNPPDPQTLDERCLLRTAGTDPDSFRRLTDPHRRELQVHCYRMLGSVHDAEDLLQETLIAAWSGIDRFEGRASLRAWLYRIATNRCLNALRDANRRPTAIEPPFAVPDPTRMTEATWLEPYPDALLDGIPDDAPGPDARYEAREAIELAFIAAVQELPPRQRAALILRDVLGFRAGEVAQMLETSEESVKAALKRARGAVEQRRPAGRPPAADTPQERELVQRFADAFEAGDIDQVVGLLTDDAWITMPPSRLEYQGPAAIGDFLRRAATALGAQRQRLVPTRANTQPAFGCYRIDPDGGPAHAAGLMVLTLRKDRITAITRFLDNSAGLRFELPPTLPV
jgi:RNA polymerase sigma-70 factor (TIGR02960 family)